MEMKFEDMVDRLCKSGANIVSCMSAKDAHLIHMVMGISGEAGELLDAIKKHTIYKKPLDRDNVIEEFGDLEFYMQGLRSSLGISREEVIKSNMKKLAVRYSGGTYSDKDAQERKDKQ